VPPKKKLSKGLLAGIIVAGALVLFGGGSVLAYNLWYQNPVRCLPCEAKEHIHYPNLYMISGIRYPIRF
jgi:hypothetical protein